MSDQLAAQIQAALARGDATAAEALCRRALAGHPNDANLHFQLGRALRARGDRASSETALRRAVALDARLAGAWHELAVLALETGRIDAADEASAQVRALMPDALNGAFLRGHVLGLLQRFDEAEREFAALRPVTGVPAARLGLVHDALARGVPAAARYHAERLVEWQPELPAAWDALGQAAAALQDWPASTAALRRASEMAPDNLPIWQRRDAALDAARQGGDELVSVRERLLQLQPDSAVALEQLGLAQIGAHHTAAAVNTFRQAAQRWPQRLLPRWVRFHTPSLPCFESEAQRAQWLQDFDQGLAEFETAAIDAESAQRILGSVPSFTLAYQDGAHVERHRRHARVVRRLLDTATGNAFGDIAPRPLRSGRRRIGLVSSCLHQHSVTRAWGEALLALPTDEFDLYVFHTSARNDAMVQRFRAHAARYVGGAHSFAVWTQWLREAELDVLIFLDLGLDVVTQCLAALRHAPVQVSTWAHPVTSGAATIDWFLSAQASEPAEGATHYSELLHRLPRLGGCFLEPPQPPLPRRAPDGDTRLVCAQNLYKLLPRHDALFGQILARAPDATLDFLTAATPEQAAGFEKRLAPVLREFAVDPARVRVHSTLSVDAYRRCVADADLLVDTLGFSGGITTLDALWQERAWLTLPGQCMRGRQSSAMLQQLGLDTLIARSEADYVERAVALADSPGQLRALAHEIAGRKHVLFGDREVCTAFIDFLHNVRSTTLSD